MPLRLITDSTAEPVTIDDVKHHLRLSTADTSEDEVLVAFIKSARQYAENYTKRAFSPQTWELTVDTLDGTYLELPRAPLSSASSNVTITYIEDTTAGDTTSLASTYYTVDYKSEPGRVYLAYDSDWPDVRNESNAVSIQYVAGYPLDSNSAVNPPESIKTWIKLRVGMLYENREGLAVGSNNWVDEFPHSFIDGLLDPYTIQTASV